jgi:uncharacterized protein with ParB-like and HNH nuclease domain
MNNENDNDECKEEDEEESYSLNEYAITSSPNDFNVKTIVDFMDKGVFKIPAFQRNYVWDIVRASKLIESLVLGLPIPQIFLYESPKTKNSFLVIDGQQRLMTIYYFLKMRFPLMENRTELRRIFDHDGKIPAETIDDNSYFTDFNLRFVKKIQGGRNKLHDLNYDTFEEKRTAFDLRTVRCIILKQNFPEDNDSSIFEIFNRLNTGGINLSPQEIRSSLYPSEFMKMIFLFNTDTRWRKLIDEMEPDLRMRDIEVFLRGFAMLLKGDIYAPSMTSFLNTFASDMTKISNDELNLLRNILENFLDRCNGFSAGIFGKGAKKLNISVYESVFSILCKDGYLNRKAEVQMTSEEKIRELKMDKEFSESASTKSTNKFNVETRLNRAREILLG